MYDVQAVLSTAGLSDYDARCPCQHTEDAMPLILEAQLLLHA